jgi:hypothetical protein
MRPVPHSQAPSPPCPPPPFPPSPPLCEDVVVGSRRLTCGIFPFYDFVFRSRGSWSHAQMLQGQTDGRGMLLPPLAVRARARAHSLSLSLSRLHLYVCVCVWAVCGPCVGRVCCVCVCVCVCRVCVCVCVCVCVWEAVEAIHLFILPPFLCVAGGADLGTEKLLRQFIFSTPNFFFFFKRKDLSIWGTGKPLRQFIFSRDLADLVIWATLVYEGVFPLFLSLFLFSNLQTRGSQFVPSPFC